jgi:hypothetical protein
MGNNIKTDGSILNANQQKIANSLRTLSPIASRLTLSFTRNRIRSLNEFEDSIENLRTLILDYEGLMNRDLQSVEQGVQIIEQVDAQLAREISEMR